MRQISRAAVVGAGTMGAAIAAHLANAGIPVLLLDAIPSSLTPAEATRGLTLSDPPVRNRLAVAGLARVRDARPPALFTPDHARLIACGNVADDLGRISEVDWIIEAVTERLDVKRSLFEQIDAVRRPGTIVSSNTSGLPIRQLAAGRSADFQAHFLGTHFFNPPRQMKLLEVTPTTATQPDVLETICRVAERDLGKGVVVCKDTPNFIGNRLFTFDLVFAIDYALEHGYSVEEVDALTGPLLGRPKTGTFRLLDLIGVDVMALVGGNLYPNIPADESRELLRSPRVARLQQAMVERGWLGNKTGIGFYQETRDASGRTFWPLDLERLEHRPPRPVAFESLATLVRERDTGTRLRALVSLPDRAGQYVRAVLGHFLGYASRRLPEIADDVRSVDRAMRWGFNHALGPFEIWDALGVAEGARLVEEQDAHGVAPWVQTMLRAGRHRFYEGADSRGSGEETGGSSAGRAGGVRADDGAVVSYWDVARGAPVRVAEPPELLSVSRARASRGVVIENQGASLVDLGDGVAALHIHTKLNTLDDRVAEMIHRSLERVRASFAGMVITGAGEHFSAGANLASIAGLSQRGDWDTLDRAIKGLQDAFMAIRFSPEPVVAAPFGWTLGGGAELAMAAARIVAAAETYIGQTEVAVGLLPAAGGCKELLRRVVNPAALAAQPDPRPALQRVFELIARGTIAGSAAEGRLFGFLTPTDRIVMNGDHVLSAAKREVLSLVDQGYRPPTRGHTIYAAGRDALAALKVAIHLHREAEYASPYDSELASRCAYILTGGELSEPTWVDEQYILNLERATFLDLCRQPQTQERIRHFLETGKTLRN